MGERESATGVLKSEHQVILKVLDVLEKILNRVDEGGSLDDHGMERCLTFFRLFADACHHGKEEDVLFPELESAGIPRQGGPIGVMLYEHQQGRELVRQMGTALEASRATKDRNWCCALVQAGRSYVDLLRRHIGKEDHCLFAMAEQVMDEAGCGRVCSAYQQVCHRKFEGLSHSALEALADGLWKQYISSAACDRRPSDSCGCSSESQRG